MKHRFQVLEGCISKQPPCLVGRRKLQRAVKYEFDKWLQQWVALFNSISQLEITFQVGFHLLTIRHFLDFFGKHLARVGMWLYHCSISWCFQNIRRYLDTTLQRINSSLDRWKHVVRLLIPCAGLQYAQISLRITVSAIGFSCESFYKISCYGKYIVGVLVEYPLSTYST